MSIELIEEDKLPNKQNTSQASSSRDNPQQPSADEILQNLEKKYLKNVELLNDKKANITKLNEELISIQNDTLKSLLELSNAKETYLVSLVKAQNAKLMEINAKDK